MCYFFFKKISSILLDDIVRSGNLWSPCRVDEHRVLQNFPPILYGPECHPVGPPNVESPLNHGPHDQLSKIVTTLSRPTTRSWCLQIIDDVFLASGLLTINTQVSPSND